ncbi:peptidylprolyl isomerase [Leptothoe sp. LEGE 181152]|nr:peptidylprolyl isomerase [Leptothoe sp. LEGE 181152]
MTDFSKADFTSEEIVSYLKQTTQLKGIYQKLLSQKVIQHGARIRNITVTPSDVEAEAERLRREYHLEKATDTFIWLADHLMGVDDWEAGIYSNLLEKKLKESLFASDVEKYFSQKRLQFDQVLLYQLQVKESHIATEIRYQILEKEITFYAAAHVYDINLDRQLRCGYEGKLCRWQLEPHVAAAIFGSPPDSVIGPIETDSGYSLFMVKAFIAAQLTQEIRQEIIQELFDEWLAQEINHLVYSDLDSNLLDPAFT